jgi:hypothetical protein
MKILLVLPMVSLSAVSALSSVPFGGLELQLKSSATDKDPETLLVEVLTQTVQFLDGTFTDTLQATDIEFSHIGLSVDTYDIDDTTGESSVIFGFSGTAFFNSRPPPTEDEVHQILVKSFFGRNSQEFTSSLMKSSDPFLQLLSHSMVQVNGYVVPGGVPQETAAPQEPPQSNEGFDFEMIAIIVGSTTGALLFILLCYCFWCAGDPDEHSDDTTRKTPTQTGQTPIRKSQTSQTDDVEAASAAPSSPQSIISQDSSIFTYNPSSKISFDASTIMSTNTTETNPVDLALWQQRNTIVNSRFAPFGHDISAIEMLNDNKKDLSLIEEGDESATPVKSMEYLSKDLLSQRERRERSRGRDAGCSFISEQSDNTDVIADLRNLSQQINHYRRR